MAEPYIFQNDGTGQFSQISLGLGVYDSTRLGLGLAAVDLNGDSPVENSFSSAEQHYGLVVADLEKDGYPELIIGVHEGSPSIFTNPCGEGNWLQVELVGPSLNTEGFGAKVILTRDGRVEQQEMSNLHTVSQAPSVLYFGLGENIMVSKIEVLWPDGTHSIATNFEGNRMVTIQHSED